jgi:two-component system response regulator PilR (NtrC family)
MYTAQKTILIVDDDEEIRDLLVLLINSAEAILELAGTVADARKIIERQQIDIMILDLFLPDGNGLSLLDYWNQLHRSMDHPCAIIISAFGNWENYLNAYQHEAFCFVEKPFKISKMRSLVEDALRKAQAPHVGGA